MKNWKDGPITANAHNKIINRETRVLALEIEVDSWVSTPTAFIDDVMINGELVQNFDGDQDIEVDVNGFVTAVISPSLLNFGNLLPGTFGNPGPMVTIDPTGSNVGVRVSVSDVTGFPFVTGLKFDGVLAGGQMFDMNCVGSPICTYTPKEIDTTLDIPAGAASTTYTGTVTYTIAQNP
ncbi:MAG: hypothetical protein V1889_03210 [archaeon]